MTRMQALALAVAVAAACEKDPPSTAPPDDASVDDEASAEDEPTADEPAEAESEPAEKKADPVQWTLEIDGRVTKAQIDALLQEHLNAIRECYDDALTHPDGIELKGAIVIAFEVDKAGKVGSVALAHSEFGHPPTEKCLVGVVEAFELPKQKGASKVKLPFYMNVL